MAQCAQNTSAPRSDAWQLLDEFVLGAPAEGPTGLSAEGGSGFRIGDDARGHFTGLRVPGARFGRTGLVDDELHGLSRGMRYTAVSSYFLRHEADHLLLVFLSVELQRKKTS